MPNLPNDITDAVLSGNIAGITDSDGIFQYPHDPNNVTNRLAPNVAVPQYLQGQIQNNPTAVLQYSPICFYTPAFVEFARINAPINYLLVSNTQQTGVNSVCIDTAEYLRSRPALPLFISSSGLSGCAVLCLLTDAGIAGKKVLFLHAGNATGQNPGLDANAKKILYFNMLFYDVLRILNLPLPQVIPAVTDAESLAENLLANVPSLIAGTLTYSGDDNLTSVTENNRMIHCYPYNVNNGIAGGSYCLMKPADANNTAASVSIAASGYLFGNNWQHTDIQSYCTYVV